MAMETWMRAPMYGSLVVLLCHCGLEQASQSQSVPKNQGKTQVKMGDTLAVSQPTEPPKVSENLVAAKPEEPPKVSENLVAAKPEEPPKVSEKPDATADCLGLFSADRIPGIGIVNGLTVGIGNGFTGWTPEIKMCPNGQWLTKLGLAYKRCGIPLPSSLQNLAFSAVLEPCYDQGIPMAIGVVGF